MASTPKEAASMKTAIVTGGCSGIGLGLVQHLLAKPNWRVVVADIRPEAYASIKSVLDESRTLFVPTDVSKWEDNATLFKQAYEWSGGRLDFFAANAGIADKEPTLGPQDLDAEPVKPNLACIDVVLVGVFYGLKLFLYHSRKTQRDMLQNKVAGGAVSFNPKMVITASSAGLYPFAVAPQYNAAKHGLVGLTRAVGNNLYHSDNMCVNAICPGYVQTGLTPPGLEERWPKEFVTPISTMLRAYDELIHETGKVEQDGLSDGVDGTVKTGNAVECCVNKLYYRDPIPYPDESQKFCIEESLTPDGLWAQSIAALTRKLQAGHN